MNRSRRPTARPAAVPPSAARPRAGETLTADTSGISDAGGLTGASFSYQWLRMAPT